MKPKVWWQSKTILFNIASAIAALLPLLFGAEPAPAPQGFISGDQALDAANATLPALEAGLPLLREILPAQYYGWLAGLVIGGNMLLRAVTEVRVVLKRPKESL